MRRGAGAAGLRGPAEKLRSGELESGGRRHPPAPPAQPPVSPSPRPSVRTPGLCYPSCPSTLRRRAPRRAPGGAVGGAWRRSAARPAEDRPRKGGGRPQRLPSPSPAAVVPRTGCPVRGSSRPRSPAATACTPHAGPGGAGPPPSDPSPAATAPHRPPAGKLLCAQGARPRGGAARPAGRPGPARRAVLTSPWPGCRTGRCCCSCLCRTCLRRAPTVTHLSTHHSLPGNSPVAMETPPHTAPIGRTGGRPRPPRRDRQAAPRPGRPPSAPPRAPRPRRKGELETVLEGF